MALLNEFLQRRRLILATSALLALAGLISWQVMPREEDPQFPHRDALIIAPYPGADAETVERLVVEPLEEYLAEVEQVFSFDSTARANVAIVHVELYDNIYDTDEAWDDVRESVAKARREFPTGVPEPEIDDDLISQEAIVLAVTGSVDPLKLAEGAERLRHALLGVSGVKEIALVADPGEQITIEYDDPAARRLGLDPQLLGRALALRTTALTGGLIHIGSKTASLRPTTEFESIAELNATPIPTGNGMGAIPLGELARVRRGPSEPTAERMRWRGEPAVGLGIVPKNTLDRIAFGRDIRALIEEMRPELAPLVVEEVVFQPDQVETRLEQLSQSLLLGIAIVAGVLLITMGPRLGFLVALVVPLVSFASIAIYAMGGGILQQISIAGLVIALGMLVDNAIVVAENIQWNLDRGDSPPEAAANSVRELAMPLGTATGTTLAAFVPMLMSKGNTADFTRTIPIMIMLTLTLSYFFAVLVTPVLAELILRPRGESEPDQNKTRSGRFARRVANFAVGRSGWVMIGAALLLAISVLAAGSVDQQFFPAGDRELVMIDLELPEGTHLEDTDALASRAEVALREHPEVVETATFIGRSAPRFYYNLLRNPNSPHLAQLVVFVRDLESVESLIAWVREDLRHRLPEATVVARKLQQGPPIEAPVEVRVFGQDLEKMEEVADQVLATLREIPEARDVRHDLGLGVPSVRVEIDDAAAGRHGLSRHDVALTLLGRTLGATIGQYRMGDDPAPILIRSSAGENLSVAALRTTDVSVPGRLPVPLEQVARLSVEWQPAAIYHRERQRVVTVQAQVAAGSTAHAVAEQLRPRLDALELPPGMRLKLGGELEESGAANQALLGAMPLGVMMLLFFLLAEFNSFRRVAIILMTVPLSAIGVVPGLLLTNNPLGFTSILGIIALVGIVVNNAIVLLDVTERERDTGKTIDEALAAAVMRRTRPILLTMATTVAGLLPLALSDTTLWPPMAWAMISGLIASTVLTLLVIPALYRLLFRPESGPRITFGGRRTPSVAVTSLVAMLLTALSVSAQEPLRISLAETLERAAERPASRAVMLRAESAEQAAEAERRGAWRPQIQMEASIQQRDRDFIVDTPLGSLTLGERTSQSVSLTVGQPLFDRSRQRFGVPAARSEAAAALQGAQRARRGLALEAAFAYLDVLTVDAQLSATQSFVDRLADRLRQVEALVEVGRVLEADALKIRLDLEAAQLDLFILKEARKTAMLALGRAVGHEGPVEPNPEASEFEQIEDIPPREELLQAALTKRHDIAALSAQIDALDLRAAAVGAERLPQINAGISLQASNDPFAPEELIAGAVNLRWTPFAGGTRAPRRAAIEAQRDAIAADLADLKQTLRIEIDRAAASLRTSFKAVEVRARGVELANEALRVERERHAAGRATVNDLLDAESSVRVQSTQSELAAIEVLRARLLLDFSLGRNLFEVGGP